MTYCACVGLTAAPGPRMAGAHQRQRHFQIAFAAAQLPAQQRELLAGDQIQMLERDPDRHIPRRRLRIQLFELQRDALAEIARGNAGGLQRLNDAQHALNVGGRRLDLRQQAQAHVLERVLQISIIGDRIGDDPGDRHVDRRKLGQFQLLDQLLLQGLAVLIAEIAAAIIIARIGSVGGAAGLFAPSLIGDLHFRGFG